MAWNYLRESGCEHGTEMIRQGIQKYNAKNGVLHYHETVTLFFVRLIDMAIAEYPSAVDFASFLRAYPALEKADILHAFYSEAALKDPLAKQQYVCIACDAVCLTGVLRSACVAIALARWLSGGQLPIFNQCRRPQPVSSSCTQRDRADPRHRHRRQPK